MPSMPIVQQKLDNLYEGINDYDMLEADLSDADVIFVHATCMMPELINSLGHKLRTCKPTTRFVMVSRGFFGPPWFTCIDRVEYVNAWKSTSTAHIYKLAPAN